MASAAMTLAVINGTINSSGDSR